MEQPVIVIPTEPLPPDATLPPASEKVPDRTAWRWLGYLLETRPLAFWGSVWVSVVLVAVVAVGSLLSPSAAERRSVSAIALGSDSGVVTQPAENRGKMPLWVFGAIVFSCTAGSIFVSRQLQATTAPLPPTARSKRARRSPQGTVTAQGVAAQGLPPAIGDTTFAPVSAAMAQAESPRPLWGRRSPARSQAQRKQRAIAPGQSTAQTQPQTRRRQVPQPAPSGLRSSLLSAMLSPLGRQDPRPSSQRRVKSRGKAAKSRQPQRLAPYSPHEPLLTRQVSPAIAPPPSPTHSPAIAPVASPAPYTMPPVMRVGKSATPASLHLPNPPARSATVPPAIAPAPSFVIAAKNTPVPPSSRQSTHE